MLEAKHEELDPYDAKEQARGYAENLRAPFIILRSVRICVPPLSLQHRFSACVADTRALQEQQAKTSQRLDYLYQSTLHRTFREGL